MQTTFKYRGEQISIKGFSDDDWISKAINTYKSYYELDLLEYIRFVLKDRQGLILDIGANIGNHSVFFGKHMGRKVICFEPNKPVFNILNENLQNNNVDNITFEIGLGESEGSFRVDTEHANAHDNVGAARLEKSDHGNILVKRLDDVIAELPLQDKSVAAMKIDVEGMEADVLKGATKTLSKHKPELFVEAMDDKAMKILEDILIPLGYEKICAYAGTPVWHFAHKSQGKSALKFKLMIFPPLWFARRVYNKLLRTFS